MQKSTFPKIPLFFSIIFFACSCAAFFFFYRTIGSNHQELELKEAQWQAETDRRNEIKALDRSVKMVEGERTELATHFAQSSDVVPFLDTIEALAPSVGAKAEVSSVEISSDRKVLIVGMKASGTFSSLYKFTTLLENSPYALQFIGVELDREALAESGKQGVALPAWSAFFKLKLLSFTE